MARPGAKPQSGLRQKDPGPAWMLALEGASQGARACPWLDEEVWEDGMT